MAKNIKNWRDAASLLLVAKQTFSQQSIQTNRINYKILTMKRSSSSSFMPDTHVFPGGSLDKADCSQDWLKLYKKFGINEQHFDIFKKVKYIAPIFTNDGINIPRYISLRICAIREAFEECGVLLCKSSKQENNGNATLFASYCGGEEINKWQKTVHKDASKFIELCDKFKIYPDIWSLHEWSNWLTPVQLSKRFDTMFFLANVQNILPTFAEQGEVQQILWESPEELLHKNHKSEIFLPPVQYYELYRLMNFDTIEKLSEFSLKRSLNGSERIFPYRLATDKINASIFIGDDLYPGEETAEIPNEEIWDEIPEKNSVHRMYHNGIYANKLVIKNCKYKVEHVYPLLQKHFGSSKL